MNRNSAQLWLPAAEAVAPSPKTVMVPIAYMKLWGAIENEGMTDEEREKARKIIPVSDADNSFVRSMREYTNKMRREMPSPSEYAAYYKEVVDKARAACEEVGYPVFLRTDLSSGKHSGPGCYRIDNPDQIISRIMSTLEDNELKWLQPEALMFRQHLDLDAQFTMFDGFPIAREWRLFASPDGALCYHPYWPEEVIKEYDPPEGWEETLREHHVVPACMPELQRMAVEACKLLGGSWSVDFSCDRNGKWWLTDMAVAEDSYHMPGCEHNPAKKQEG